ncbi:ATP-binding cassette domain-containing protein [Actinoplanes sp. Pm04-4]|uniref:ATP-binding cassette domain-containing protein n=1 Tax=Paractinoplanes pyxinae TaxID=2997416 RepID=A0ABT4B674_9ACTN|nr:ATP-binding cassette domain-containing protein [Actinoplanes pyxinae]MCY1141537.1 ATP-binding cassette domain-containing protein [Actinoplanes pyxinae]
MITFSHVSLVFPGTRRATLSNLSFEIARGEFAFIIGPTGSGKTSIIRLLMRQVEATWGTVTVNNRDLSRASFRQFANHRRAIGFMSQEYELAYNRTAYENVAMTLELLGKTKALARRVVPEMLELVGMGGREHHYPHELSGIDQRRVMAARAFINQPLMLLADEPTAAVDPDSAIELMRLFDRINRTGTTVIMTTTDANIVNQMRRRVLEVERGKLVRDQARGVYG